MKKFVGALCAFAGVLALVSSGLILLACGFSYRPSCGYSAVLGIPFFLGLFLFLIAYLLLSKNPQKRRSIPEKIKPMIICPKCHKETPGSLEQCLWCNHELSHKV